MNNLLFIMLTSCVLLHAEQASGQGEDTLPPKHGHILKNVSAEVVDSPSFTSQHIGAAELLDPEPDASETVAGRPHATIAPQGEIALGCWILLDASGSSDPLNRPLQFEWKQLSGPPLKLSLGDAKLWLFLTEPGDYRLTVRAGYNECWSPPAEAKFHVNPGRSALTEQEGRKVVGAGELVHLTGEGWRQIKGTTVELRDEDGGMAFRPVQAGLYLFEALRAGDVPERRGVLVPPGLDAVLGDRRPVAKLPRELQGFVGMPLIVDASMSFDPDGPEETQKLTARWTTVETYRGLEIETLLNLKARMKAQLPGSYKISVNVSDGRLESEPPVSVYVQIQDMPFNADEFMNGEIVGSRSEPFEITGHQDGDVRYKIVTLGLWGNLDRAVQLFPSRCGASLLIDKEVASPDRFESIPLSLEVINGALIHLLDWIARQTDSNYRRKGNNSFWLMRSTGFIKPEKLQAVNIVVDALHSLPDGSDLMAILRPWTQRIIAATPGSSIGFEPSRDAIQAVLPASACARLKEICGALRSPGYGLPPREAPAPRERILRRFLAEKRITLQCTGRRLDYLLRDLSQAAGIATGMDARQFGKELPLVNIEILNAPLRDAVRTIVDAGGFDGCSVEEPAGLWFYRGSRPRPSSELLWDQSVVRDYDLSELLAAITPLSGEVIAYAIQRRIFPATWTDPGATIFYHAPTRKLLVLHAPIAHKRILEFLQDLYQRGEWALGPTNEAFKK